MPSDRFNYYVNECAKFHVAKKTFSGRGCLKHAKALLEFSRSLGAESALDYGCGKTAQYQDILPSTGKLLEESLGYSVFKYDPAVPRFDMRPPSGTKFDLVWCTDVMEHIPEEDIPWVIADLVGFAAKGLFVTVATYPAKKCLLNGENAHVTVKPREWWIEQFAGIESVRLDLLVE